MSKEFSGVLKTREIGGPDKVPTSFDHYGKDYVTLPTLLIIGAVAQMASSLYLPPKIAILPATLLALRAVVATIVQCVKDPKDYASMRDVMPGRTKAQLPSRETGLYGYDPAAHDVVVFHFGSKSHHPLGMLGSGGRGMIERSQRCFDAIHARADEYGMLGVSRWLAGDATNANAVLFVFYFRDVAGLNRFAHDGAHREAWDFAAGQPEHVDFYHETFAVPRRAYESVYVNMPPKLMGHARVRCDAVEDGQQRWVGSLVSADAGSLRTQYGRVGRGSNKENEGSDE